jgi:hypothetical protein
MIASAFWIASALRPDSTARWPVSSVEYLSICITGPRCKLSICSLGLTEYFFLVNLYPLLPISSNVAETSHPGKAVVALQLESPELTLVAVLDEVRSSSTYLFRLREATSNP